jgi:hypothetical protein
VQGKAHMSERIESTAARPLTEDEKALIRRCCRVRSISDDEIVFPIDGPALGRAAWFAFIWGGLAMLYPIAAWGHEGRSEMSSLAWVFLGIIPTFFLSWLVARRPASLVIERGARTMTTVLHDGRWTIHLPRGSSPMGWSFPTAAVPVRTRADDVEGVEAWAILGRFSGSDLSEKSEDSPLAGLRACGADVLGYDKNSLTLANSGSARLWVAALGLGAAGLLPLNAFFVIAMEPSYAQTATAVVVALSILGTVWTAYDSRSSNVATFIKGKGHAIHYRRGRRRTVRVNRLLVRITSDGDSGEFVSVLDVFSFAPYAGTATALASFLQRYIDPEQSPEATPGS